MTTHDLVIRNGTVVDGNGGAPVQADVAIDGDTITAVGSVEGTGRREIDATGRIVTPGFVDIHTHLDAQIAWDPIGSSSCWHGVTSVVMGNCGVTFAPVRETDAAYLAEVMESVEDIPATSILEGLPWNWSTYGEYLKAVDAMPKGINVGGMVGHVAVRWHAMGEASLSEDPASADQIAAMCALVEEAVDSGALGFSTSRTLLHVVPDGRPVPGTWASDDELIAIGDVLGRLGKGVFESAPRFERAGADAAGATHEIEVLGEITRRTGRPATFGLAQSDARADLYRIILDEALRQNEAGGRVRPQTTCRSIGVVFGLAHRTPWSRGAAWQELDGLSLADRVERVRDPQFRARLVDDASGSRFDARNAFVLMPDDPDYRQGPDQSLAAMAEAQDLSPVELFLRLVDETDGAAMLNLPFLNQSFDAIEDMMREPTVVLGLADAGAHVGQIMDASQATFFLSHWVRDREFFSLAEGVRRLTTDTADLFGLADRGRLQPGAKADVNIIDLDALALTAPEYVHDFPGGAGRYIQKATGYDATIVNGQVFMESGEHTGVFAGTTLRS